MNVTTGCPTTEVLEQLLSGSLPAEQQQECTRHMDACEYCQNKLEQLATAGTNLSRVVERLHEARPVAESAYWPAIAALTADLPSGESKPSGQPKPAGASRRRDISLNFLQPASDTAYLGRLGQFDVMRVVGRGGMGVVFEAFDSRLQRNVAIKVLDPDLAGDEISRQRFCREARAAASIAHENVVAIHQVEKWADEGLPYMVMQLIAGESLEQRLLRESRLPLREIVRIGMQAAQGLAAAHAQGLIHRDIKPGNILIEASHDQVKLTDFGLARVAQDVKLTSTGFVLGTPLYMAPEQALGEPVDHRSDLFSLGAILYEMCAGQPPFVGNSALMILKQIVDEKPRPLRELNPAVPQWLVETIDRLLAKRPADRLQSAAELAELFEFEWALMKTSSQDVPTVCQEKARRNARRNRRIALAVGTTFLTLGLLGGWLLAPRAGREPEAAGSSAEPVALFSANAGPVWSVAFDPASDTVAMAVEDGKVRLWDLPSQSIQSTLDAHRGIVWATRFAHAGKLLATAGDDGLIELWQPGETAAAETFHHPSAVRSVEFAGDDRTLFAGDRAGSLRVWSCGAAEPLAMAQQPGAIYALALSPNDETLATAGSDKVVRLWNAKTLAPKLPLEGHNGPVYGLAFSRDGRRLASVGWDHTVRIWNVASGLPHKSWEAHGADIWSIAYSPDGRRLATGGHDGAVRLWDAETGEPLATFLGHKVAIHAVAFHPDGKLLGSGGRDGAVRVWRVE